MAYRKVDERFWISARIAKLSQDAKFLYLYLLTCPHNNLLTCYRLPDGYALEDLGWKPERLREQLQELLGEPFADGSQGLVAYDPETKLIAVKGQLEKEGMANPNAAKAAEKVLSELPGRSPVYAVIIEGLERLNKPFLKPLIERLRERLPEPLPERYGELQEQEQLQEQEYISPSLRSGDISADPEAEPAEPPVLTLPVLGGGEFPVTQAQVSTWSEAYPAVDVSLALRQMREWIESNPTKKRRNVRRFITNWLKREQERGGNRGRGNPVGMKPQPNGRDVW